MKIAVWSGPRNLSTAMMYCFGGHPDFSAMDEPFYAAYLAATNIQHPMQQAILDSQPIDPQDVVLGLLEPNIDGKKHTYQKHMTHHMLPDFPIDWMAEVEHVFLIRHPARVLASYRSKREKPTLADIGFVQQLDIFEKVKALGKSPVLVDSSDIRSNPDGMIHSLCDALGVEFDPKMMTWKAGPKPYDGVWADHWYNAVHESTVFSAGEDPIPDVGAEYADILRAALEVYETLAAHKLKV